MTEPLDAEEVFLYDWTDLLLPVAGAYVCVPDDGLVLTVPSDGLDSSLPVDTIPLLLADTVLLDDENAEPFVLLPIPVWSLLPIDELVPIPLRFTGILLPEAVTELDLWEFLGLDADMVLWNPVEPLCPK